MTKYILELWDEAIPVWRIAEMVKEMLPVSNKTCIMKRDHGQGYGLVIQKTTLKSGTMKFCIYKETL